jgi:hypothetical protein
MLPRKLPLNAIFRICLLIATLHLVGCGDGDASVSLRFAYVANNGSNDVSAFTIDATTGALTTVPGTPFVAGAGPDSVAITGSIN